jgi:hypothetical protein
MIPNIPESALPDVSQINAKPDPGYTYKLDLSSKRIVGMVDGRTAVTQAIYKILYTERYAWLIYNWDYGMELEHYLGLDFDYVMADLERAITEALQVDDRVLEIQNFVMKKTRIDALYVEFLAITTEGNIAIGWEVPLP